MPLRTNSEYSKLVIIITVLLIFNNSVCLPDIASIKNRSWVFFFDLLLWTP